MADAEEWSSNSNDALHVRLRSRSPKTRSKDVAFHPTFTYPIFGNEETIFGYRGLKIRLDFTADTLDPHLEVTHGERYEPVGDTMPDDVEGIMKDFLPEPKDFRQLLGENDPFEPPGELVHEYQVNGQSYGIWTASLLDKRAKDILENMQIFVLFFIEGGSYIDLDDPDWTMQRWRIFFVYSIDQHPGGNANRSPSYSLVGYSTAYTLFFLDRSTITEDNASAPAYLSSVFPSSPAKPASQHLPSRSRISQFIILPPYQSHGHGHHLYSTMISHFLHKSNTKEITVEDPNESFDDLRDTCDILRLRQDSHDFSEKLRINTKVTLPNGGARKSALLPTASLLPRELLLKIRADTKLAARQFQRLVEMHLLSLIPPRNRQPARLTRKEKATDENDRAYYFWRLLVKQRLYKHNVDTLAQLDLEERLEKLEEVLQGVESDYLRVLEKADRREARVAEMAADETLRTGKGSEKGNAKVEKLDLVNGDGDMPTRGVKRRVIDDEDEEEEEDSKVSAVAAKKTKA